MITTLPGIKLVQQEIKNLRRTNFAPLFERESPQVLIYSAISSRSRFTNSVEQEVQQMVLIKFPPGIKD